MRLSTVFELLLIFLLIAFAAYGRVIDRNEFTIHREIRAINESKQANIGVEVISLKQAAENVNKYCTCNTHICNCCRNFNIPIVQLKGPGCASLQYLERDKLGVQLSMGDNILTSTIVNGQKPKAVCFPMPGGLTKFCGRIYSIQREADNHFKACLGLELQSSSELEAALRVSCFRFGPDGVKLRPAEQLPIVEEDKPSDDEEDDDDDFFGLGDDDDDDDDDDEEEDTPEGNAVPNSSASNDETDDDDDDDDDDDILGFGAFLDILTGDDAPNKKKKPQITTASPILPFTIPILTKPITETASLTFNDISDISSVGSVKPLVAKPTTIGQSTAAINVDNVSTLAIEASSDDVKVEEPATTQLSPEILTNNGETSVTADLSTIEETSLPTSLAETSVADNIVAGASNDLQYIVKPDKQTTIIKKVTGIVKKKPSLTSGSVNAIKNDAKKPIVSSVIITKPNKPNNVQTYVVDSLNNVNNYVNEDDDEDDDILGSSDLDDEDEDEDEDDDEKFELENEDEKNEEDNEDTNETENEKNEEQEEEEAVDDLIDDDDDDEEEEDEEEDAVITALVDDDSDKIKDKVADNVAANHEDDDADYGLGLAELLSRKRHMRTGRQSKVMRL